MSSVEKKAFYQRGDVVSAYDDWRFGSAGGRYVNTREIDGVVDLLADVPRDGRVLDLPCGTGRVLEKLSETGFSRLFAGDYSTEMLRTTRSRVTTSSASRHDALRTGIKSNTFDAIVSMRFTFHTPDLAALLQEFGRVAKPGGVVVFDTLRWSPRTVVPGLDARLGGTLWTYSDEDVRRAAFRSGLAVDAMRPMLILPSFAYRFVPERLVPRLDQLEKSVPEKALSKVLWRLRKVRST